MNLIGPIFAMGLILGVNPEKVSALPRGEAADESNHSP